MRPRGAGPAVCKNLNVITDVSVTSDDVSSCDVIYDISWSPLAAAVLLELSVIDDNSGNAIE